MAEIYIRPSIVDETGATAPASFRFDATLNVIPTKTKTLTKHPTSDKNLITNHSVKSNPTLSLTGYISRYPTQFYNDNLVGYETLQQRPRLALDLLKKWFDDDTELFIADEYDTYDRYVMTSLNPVVEGSLDSLRFDLTFEHVRRVTYQRGILTRNMTEELALNSKENSSSGSAKNKKDWDETFLRGVAVSVEEAGSLVFGGGE